MEGPSVGDGDVTDEISNMSATSSLRENSADTQAR